jgi:hypothetical protein
MDLIKILKNEGYDYIDGIIRGHKPLQLWRDRMSDEPKFLADHISHVFNSDVKLNEVVNPGLNVNSTMKLENSFNIGLTGLDRILNSLGIGSLGLSSEFKSGKSMSISFNDTIAKEYGLEEIDSYLFDADLVHPNPQILTDLNRDNVLILTGVIYAKNFEVILESSVNLKAEVEANIKNIVDGKLIYERKSESSIKLSAAGVDYFPIAVKAIKVVYRHGRFIKTKEFIDNHIGF